MTNYKTAIVNLLRKCQAYSHYQGGIVVANREEFQKVIKYIELLALNTTDKYREVGLFCTYKFSNRSILDISILAEHSVVFRLNYILISSNCSNTLVDTRCLPHLKPFRKSSTILHKIINIT